MVYAKLHRGKVTHLNNFICACMEIIQTSIYLVFKGLLVYSSNSSCHSSSFIFALLAEFFGICTAISSSIANSVKFSAIFLLRVPRASRMRAEVQLFTCTRE